MCFSTSYTFHPLARLASRRTADAQQNSSAAPTHDVDVPAGVSASGEQDTQEATPSKPDALLRTSPEREKKTTTAADVPTDVLASGPVADTGRLREPVVPADQLKADTQDANAGEVEPGPADTASTEMAAVPKVKAPPARKTATPRRDLRPQDRSAAALGASEGNVEPGELQASKASASAAVKPKADTKATPAVPRSFAPIAPAAGVAFVGEAASLSLHSAGLAKSSHDANVKKITVSAPSPAKAKALAPGSRKEQGEATGAKPAEAEASGDELTPRQATVTRRRRSVACQLLRSQDTDGACSSSQEQGETRQRVCNTLRRRRCFW